MTVQRLRFASIETPAEGIRHFRLVSAEGEPLLPASAGAHIDLHLPSGLTRQYSLFQQPLANHYEIAVKREPGSRGGSSWLHEQAVVGMVLDSGEPRSILVPSREAARHVLVAGGIGITPMLSLARHFTLAAVPFELHYFVRTPEQAVFLKELNAIMAPCSVKLQVGTLPEHMPAAAAGIAATLGDGDHVYLCGPGPFMDVLRAEAEKRVDAARVHEERFTPAKPVSTDAISNVGTTELVLARRGVTLTIARGRSILDAMVEQGKSVDHSCEQGFCGTCMTAVLEGEVEHHDTFLTEEERQSGEWVMPCVGRACSARLVLDC